MMKMQIALIGIIFLLLSGFTGYVIGEAPAADVKKMPESGDLIKELQGEKVESRLRAKSALIRMGEDAGPALLKALSVTPVANSYDLIEILSIIRYGPAKKEIEKIWQETKDRKVKLMAAQALCRLDYNYARYQSYILSQTKTGTDGERLEAMQMLGYIGDKRVVDPLVKIFLNQKNSDQVRQAAIWDLGHTPVKESAAALTNLVNDAKVDWFYKEIIIASLRTLATNKEMAPVVSELLQQSQNIPAPDRKSK